MRAMNKYNRHVGVIAYPQQFGGGMMKPFPVQVFGRGFDEEVRPQLYGSGLLSSLGSLGRTAGRALAREGKRQGRVALRGAVRGSVKSLGQSLAGVPERRRKRRLGTRKRRLGTRKRAGRRAAPRAAPRAVPRVIVPVAAPVAAPMAAAPVMVAPVAAARPVPVKRKRVISTRRKSFVPLRYQTGGRQGLVRGPPPYFGGRENIYM